MEIREDAFTDDMTAMQGLRTYIEHELKRYLNIAAEVELMPPGSLPRFEGKAKHVVDTRSKLS